MCKLDIFETVTNRIIERMKTDGKAPWLCPYKIRKGFPMSHQTGKRYSLLNALLLGEGGEYWTFNQVKKAGFRIKKGSKAKRVVFWKILFSDEEKQLITSGEITPDQASGIPYLTYYNVFGEDDIDGLETVKQSDIDDETRNSERIEDAEAIISDYFNSNGAPEFIIKDRIPCYAVNSDSVIIPQKSQFVSLGEYYRALFHEMVHSTGAKKRLNRDQLGLIDNKQSYSREELVAEIGSAFLAQICNLPIDEERNSAAYLNGWIRALKNDPKWIVWAAGRAEKAVQFILMGKHKDLFQEEEHE